MFGNWSSGSQSENRSVKDNARSLFQRSGLSTARYEAGVSGNLTEYTEPRQRASQWQRWEVRIFHFGARIGRHVMELQNLVIWKTFAFNPAGISMNFHEFP